MTFISTREKTVFTAVTLFIYLLCCQIPLYGVVRAEGSDPFYWMRVILASNRGTLMELGLSPVISAGWILQILVGLRIIEADLGVAEDKRLYDGTQKLLAMILAVGEGIAYILSGAYGSLDQIGTGNAMLILLQLTVSSFIVILLDEMLEHYGLGSGISLFIAANMCELIVWKSLSPITIRSEYGTEFEGSLIALIHFLLTKPNKISALYQAFFRSSSPNLASLTATVLIFFLVIYLQSWKVELNVASKKYRGYTRPLPIRLFYTSNISVIFQSAFVENIYFLSSILYRRFRGSWIVGLFGTWEERNGVNIPIGGLYYWISPPRDIIAFVSEPLHSLIFTLFVMITCAIFSRMWLLISKQSASDIAKQLRDEEMVIKGNPDRSNISYLNRYIPVAATCGGMCIGLITIISNLMGVIGSGTGILLSVGIIYGYF